MYFITPSDPNIFLIGVDESQLYGIGEKNNQLCIYQKSIFDIGHWKEFFMINIKPVKCRSCKIGVHVAARLIDKVDIEDGYIDQKSIWIAARENKYTHVFSIDIDTKKFTRFKMLEEIYPEFALHNLNLCCKCLAPVILTHVDVSNFINFVITPRQYKSKVGVFQIRMTINKSNQCLLWKTMDPFTLNPDSLSNIIMGDKGEVVSITGKSEDGIINEISLTTEDDEAIEDIPVYGGGDMDKIWHEAAFGAIICGVNYLLSRRNDGDSSFLQLWDVEFSVSNTFCNYHRLEYCTVDANFPSLDSTHFFVSYRSIEKDYISKRASKIVFDEEELWVLVSSITFQSSDGKSIVSIPFRPLSLSESAYLSLARIRDPYRLPVANVSFFNYMLQIIRNLCHQNETNKNEIQKDVWMSINFIKRNIGWPKLLPLTKEPNFSN